MLLRAAQHRKTNLYYKTQRPKYVHQTQNRFGNIIRIVCADKLMRAFRTFRDRLADDVLN